jgi:hypothetical protein
VSKDRTWWPRIRRLPIFNPFEPSTKWTAQIGAGDRIEIEDTEAAEDGPPAKPPEEKTDEK